MWEWTNGSQASLILFFLKNLKVEFKSFKKTVKIGCRSGPFGPLGWAAIHQQGLAFFQK
jgi:hypothetical protein